MGGDPQRAIAAPRPLQTTQVTPPLMPQHMFASDMQICCLQKCNYLSVVVFLASLCAGASAASPGARKLLPKHAIVRPHPPMLLAQVAAIAGARASADGAELSAGHLHEAEAAT